MAKPWMTMIIAVLAGAANAASVRPTIPIYDAASLAEACGTGLADAARLIKRLETMPLGNAGARDLLDRWDRLRIRLEDFEGPVDLTANVSPDAATRSAAEACESKTTRFETELSAAEARASLARGDCRAAARHVAALHARRGGWLLGLASRMLELAPSVVIAAFRMKQRLRGAA